MVFLLYQSFILILSEFVSPLVFYSIFQNLLIWHYFVAFLENQNFKILGILLAVMGRILCLLFYSKLGRFPEKKIVSVLWSIYEQEIGKLSSYPALINGMDIKTLFFNVAIMSHFYENLVCTLCKNVYPMLCRLNDL